MRVYAYIRVNPFSENPINYSNYFEELGYEIPKNRIIVDIIDSNIPNRFRNNFFNLLNYALEEGDILLVKDFGSLGSSFEEIYSIINEISKRKLGLICLDFSKKEINGDVKKIFIHLLKICSNFENSFNNSKVIRNQHKRVGRPEILDKKQKEEALLKYKNGNSIYSIAKDYSVTRTVIQRLIEKSANPKSQLI